MKKLLPICVVILLVMSYFACNQFQSDKYTKYTSYNTPRPTTLLSQTPTKTTTQRTTPTPIVTPQPTPTPTPTEIPIDLSDGKALYKTEKYPYITPNDLHVYFRNLIGVNISTVITIREITTDAIKATIGNTIMMTTFHVSKDFTTILKENDIVAILGTVATSTDSLFGTSIDEIDNCYVFAIGENASPYAKNASAKKLSKYLTVTEKVFDRIENPTEQDYKNLCQKLNYHNILRNPDTYDGTFCKMNGTVDQIIEGIFNTITIYIIDKQDNKWCCYYAYNKGETHILEGDYITVYGKCTGTTTATTLLGKQVVMPSIDAEYITIKH